MAALIDNGIVQVQHQPMFGLTQRTERAGPSNRKGNDMAQALNIISGALPSGGRLADLIASWRKAQAKRRIYRQTMRELNALSTRELTDLGISRSMISRIAMEAAYGK
jgi:uncharacterized protein YjiS (DUF1127 family)